MKRRVVITGMGVVSPIGNDVEQVWDSVQHSRCGIDRITHFDAGDFRAKLAGEVRNLDMEQYFTKRDLKFNDRFTQFTRIAAKQAYENSGLAWFSPEEALMRSTEPWFVEHVYIKLLKKMNLCYNGIKTKEV